jgi:tetratricopeptide (TPR) repeat protein
MRRTTPLLLVTALAVVASYAVPRAHLSDRASGPAPPPVVAAVDAGGTVDGAQLDRMIGAFETQVASRPNALGFTFLGRLYLQRAKTTGDAGTYAQALRALGIAVHRSPRDPEARDLLAVARLSTHDFAGALALGRAVLAGAPADTAAIAVVGDASYELGDVRAGEQAYASLERLLPGSPGVLAREARAAFLRGHVAAAVGLAGKAVAASRHHGDFGTTAAFYSVLAGKIDLDRGAYASAVAHYRQALLDAPGWHVALAGLARATAASGRLREAIGLYQQAVDVVPQPDYLAALGDLQQLTGQRAAARMTFGTVDVLARLSALNHQLYDRLIAAYDADHGVSTQAALRIAQASLVQRKDVFGYDVLSWTLYRAGRFVEAAQASRSALAMGTPDAAMLYHSGLIAAALGDRATARQQLERALAINPQFDPLQAPRAHAALASLR